jgi:cytochrome c peroxidase
LITLASCEKEEHAINVPVLQIGETPVGFPNIDYPEDNAYSYERWLLGKKLFFDPILSKDGQVSCASCHKPNLAFSDEVSLSPGSDQAPGTRNASTLVNVAYLPYFTREGGVPTLEMQILVPIQEHNEFNNNIVLIAEALSKDSVYIQMAMKAFNQAPNPYVITRALANFERTILSGQSAYDQEIFSGIEGAMNTSALRGMKLFESDKTNCSSCHGGFNFTNYAFENNGLYLEYADEGRARLTQEEADLARFKVPTLRNIEVTAPYMHDGSIATIEAVIDHYNSGGQDHKNKSALVRPLHLSDNEKADLKAFLLSLTDSNFLNNRNLSNE